jgi:hypothetical protein
MAMNNRSRIQLGDTTRHQEQSELFLSFYSSLIWWFERIAFLPHHKNGPYLKKDELNILKKCIRQLVRPGVGFASKRIEESHIRTHKLIQNELDRSDFSNQEFEKQFNLNARNYLRTVGFLLLKCGRLNNRASRQLKALTSNPLKECVKLILEKYSQRVQISKRERLNLIQNYQDIKSIRRRINSKQFAKELASTLSIFTIGRANKKGVRNDFVNPRDLDYIGMNKNFKGSKSESDILDFQSYLIGINPKMRTTIECLNALGLEAHETFDRDWLPSASDSPADTTQSTHLTSKSKS